MVTDDPIEIALHVKAPIRFPDGGVFVATAEIFANAHRVEWYAPPVVHGFIRGLTELHEAGFEGDPEHVDRARLGMTDAIGIDPRFLLWHRALNYEFGEITEPTDPSIPVYGNRTRDLPPGTADNELTDIYRSSSDAAACVVDGKIVAIAYADNSPVSIYTSPEYRNRGFATACLRKLVIGIPPNRATPPYPTNIKNRPAQRVAEKAGYRRSEPSMYWIEIPGTVADEVPKKVWELLGCDRITGQPESGSET